MKHRNHKTNRPFQSLVPGCGAVVPPQANEPFNGFEDARTKLREIEPKKISVAAPAPGPVLEAT
jgi:hypothetical protein